MFLHILHISGGGFCVGTHQGYLLSHRAKIGALPEVAVIPRDPMGVVKDWSALEPRKPAEGSREKRRIGRSEFSEPQRCRILPF